MMPNKHIDIEGVDTNGNLILSDRGQTEVYSDSNSTNRKIIWKIKSSNPPNPVQSFLLLGKTKIHPPFEELIPTVYLNNIRLTVIKYHRKIDWDYSVMWKDTNDIVHIYDPIIAIRSSRKDDFTFPIITGLFIGLGIIGASLLLWKIKKNN